MSKDRATPSALKYRDISIGYLIIQQTAGRRRGAFSAWRQDLPVAPAKPLRVIA
jgi:hypothetical protein